MSRVGTVLSTLALLALVAVEPALSPAVAATAALSPPGPRFVAGQRQRREGGPPKRGIHELADPAGWPAEPPPPVGELDAARFDAAVTKLCGEVAPEAGLGDLARVVRDVSAERRADPFLTAALVYHQSRCRAGLDGPSGIGLLAIRPSMFAPGATLPFPRATLDPANLAAPAANLRAGLALLAMWEADHTAGEMDRVLGSTPHRTAIAHFHWGDQVWSATPEDRVLTARRRLLEMYAQPPLTFQPSPMTLDIVSPLEGVPRLGTSAPGADRADGARSHRGLDVDAIIGEPVRAVADGVVQFAGVDLTGDTPARELLPRQLRKWRSRSMGPGGFFVRIMHANGVRTGYFHLNSYKVLIGQTVHAGEVIGSVGRTGVKESSSHLHFEVHVAGELSDPVRFLSAYVLPPAQTLTHRLAMAEKRERIARLRRHARAAARHRTG